ncbi:hypothetical protein [Oceaniglobus ichthyenteri]|uniref:hypothetical protein n=1 Tax=Oceaniglobus ichthyenteri TaxID=2136177 RepID=UPI000D3B788C|nr:hypothetical protein [Oceaniglobus ichthyenteri]
MPIPSLRHAVIAAALCLAPSGAWAQQVFGTIDADIDGVARTWFLTAQDGESQSFGLSMAVANLQSFTLWGMPGADDIQTVDGALLLSFDVMSMGTQMIPLNVSLTYLESGWAAGWMADEAEQIEFSLTELAPRDDGVLVEGRFAAETNYKKPLSSGESDPSQTLQITGSFTATLPQFLIKVQ